MADKTITERLTEIENEVRQLKELTSSLAELVDELDGDANITVQNMEILHNSLSDAHQRISKLSMETGTEFITNQTKH